MALSEPSPSENILVSVNQEAITTQEFEERLRRLPPAYQVVARDHPDDFLNELIVEKLLIQQARQQRLEENERVKEIQEETNRRILMDAYVEREMAVRALVTDAEVKAYYKAHQGEFYRPRLYRASHIVVNTLDEAKAVLKALAAGKDFATLARTSSVAASRATGGDLDYFSQGQLDPVFEQAVFKLRVGQTSGIVKTDAGYHMIRLTDVKEPSLQPFEEVTEEIYAQLISEKRRKAFDELIRELKDRAMIHVHEEHLHAMGKNE